MRKFIVTGDVVITFVHEVEADDEDAAAIAVERLRGSQLITEHNIDDASIQVADVFMGTPS
jgi:hypothetical protein